jgi:hypothetical protein
MDEVVNINEYRACGSLTVLQRLNQYEFAVEIRMMREGINRNRWDYRNLDKNYTTFVGQPILCAFVNGKVGDGHNMREKTNRETGERYYSFTDATSERIVGTLSNDIDDFSIVEENGEKWLIAKGRLWEFYAPELVQKIIRTGRMDVSVETMVEESQEDGEIEVFTAWTGLGVTILGDDVQPAIPNASIKALELLKDEFAEAKLKAASYEQNESDKLEQKEQEIITERGTKEMTVLNQRELSALQETYFKDYKVLSASHDKEKGETLIFLMKNDATYQYVLGDAETTVQPERIASVHVDAHIAFDGERNIPVDTDRMINSVMTDYAMLSDKYGKLEAEAKKANDELDALKKSEAKRRIKAAKKAAEDTLKKYNLTSDVKVSESVLTKINEAIEDGDYSECEDKDGEWCGEEAVAKEVLAECAKETQKANEAKAAKERTTMVWKNTSSEKDEPTSGIEALLARNGIQND